MPKSKIKNGLERFKFSWVAFDSEREGKKVLLDCHDAKAPHIHKDEDPVGQPFRWRGVESAWELFFDAIRSHFGELEE